MKVKVLSRNPDEYTRDTKYDLHKLPRNYDPALHPFEAQREYTRALNAVKLERVFAKPFLAALDGHSDLVSHLAKHPTQLSTLYSAAADGIVKQWSIPQRSCTRTIQAHEGCIRGMSLDNTGEILITVGDDKNIRFWSASSTSSDLTTVEEDSKNNSSVAKHSIISKYVLNGVTHHAKKPIFATGGGACLIWQEDRNEPLHKYDFSVDTLSSISFNPTQTNVLGACGNDNRIMLYDIRGGGPIRAAKLRLRSNAFRWNPMEPFVFVVANEDYNAHLFDMRKLNQPLNIFMDHVSAVIDVDFSPTGKEIVTGSYDKTIRIFEVDKGRSREVYHTKRMQRLTSVLWTLDNKYIISGSDEMNIRLWKAKAWEKLGVLKTREREAMNYNEALKEKFAHFPQVKRIARHRHVPRHVYQARNEIKTIRESKSRKEGNRRAHTKPGTVPFVPERQKTVVQEQE